MFWKIFAKRLPDEYEMVDGIPFINDSAIIELSWGWDAALTEKQIKNRDPDCPTGKGSVVTNLELIKELKNDLEKIIEEAERNPPIKDERFMEVRFNEFK